MGVELKKLYEFNLKLCYFRLQVIFIIICVAVKSGEADLVEATATATIEMFLNSAKRSKEYAACVVEQMKLEMATKHIKEGEVEKFTEHFKTKISDLKCESQVFSIVVVIISIAIILSISCCIYRCFESCIRCMFCC